MSLEHAPAEGTPEKPPILAVANPVKLTTGETEQKWYQLESDQVKLLHETIGRMGDGFVDADDIPINDEKEIKFLNENVQWLQ